MIPAVDTLLEEIFADYKKKLKYPKKYLKSLMNQKSN
jgi:hypothetical protein